MGNSVNLEKNNKEELTVASILRPSLVLFDQLDPAFWGWDRREQKAFSSIFSKKRKVEAILGAFDTMVWIGNSKLFVIKEKLDNE